MVQKNSQAGGHQCQQLWPCDFECHASEGAQSAAEALLACIVVVLL